MTGIESMKGEEKFGLTTYEALDTLGKDIDQLLRDHEVDKLSWLAAMYDILSMNNRLSTFNWASFGYVLFAGVTFIFSSFFVNSDEFGELKFYGLLVVAIGFQNVFLVSWDHFLRRNEISERIRFLRQAVKECQEKCSWSSENYPHLCSPYSPCITLQWAYRDGNLVNLPWALLCQGDTIVLRPGQPAPGNCVQLDDPNQLLSCGEVYSPPQKHDHISTPTARIPFNNKRYILEETPILRNFREVLETSYRKNVSCYDKNRHLILNSCIQCYFVPILLLLMLLFGSIWYIYIEKWVSSGHWTVLFLLMPVLICLPVIPLSFSSFWIILHAFGNAKLSAFLQSNAALKVQLESAHSADPFEDISIVDEEVEAIGSGIKWGQHFLHSLFGRQHFLALTRSSNPLHVLGSVTALSCVDKKGILSWPNPTAEKIFFLKTASAKPTISRNVTVEKNVVSILEDIDADDIPQPPTVAVRKSSKIQEQCTQVEVLDLTHDLSYPFKLEFDDSQWQKHLTSLKPIGLAILLNTCNMATQEHYLQFCSHVTAEALYNEDLVPVTNRRCLCELSKQIGFTDNAKYNYTLLQQLSTFRHVQPETVRQDIKFARSLALATKLKLPFPHMVAVAMTENQKPNSLQLFSQATGDIALDSCIDFWDGTTLRTLSPSDRKKILDFYQRTSLTAYCSAFAYRPLAKSINSKLSRVYMELPADSHSLYMKNRSPTPLDWDLHESSDSLYGLECSVNGEISDIDGCFEIQCNQVFLGMVTMQYQAQIEMVQLIEQLERACIRFVHFSKENELRSRVFSEKMGLESGWNCHISLLSSETPLDDGMIEEELILDDDNEPEQGAPLLSNNVRGSLESSKSMSVSAPCAINSEHEKDCEELEGISPSKVVPRLEVSSLDWQSLSGLTDSTEQSAPINFDMSNRAKLPRGIDQIRPHLEEVDNVPLLVSLFTDCTPSTTLEMIEIMQDYGEVVCVMGSSANADNSSIFIKANTSVSVEPLYPQVCQQVPVYVTCTDGVTPVQLSQRLNSLPCSVSITRQRPISLYHLIMHARHFMQCLWNCVQFWICGMVTVSLLQLVSTAIMLPPIFTVGHVLWVSFIVVPIISLTLSHSPLNPQVMQRPGYKVQSSLSIEVLLFVLWCYGARFLPTLITIPFVYGVTLYTYCLDISSSAANATHQHIPKLNYPTVYPIPNEPWGGWGHYSGAWASAQTFAATILVFHLVAVSFGFVHREYTFWRRSPLRNRNWLSACTIITGLQLVYMMLSLPNHESSNNHEFRIPWLAIILAISSILLIVFVNEFVKWQEIKAIMRYEKRARLDFGTKLGMNSPF